MKNFFLLFSIAIFSALNAQVDKQYPSKKARYDFYNQFAKKYNSPSIQEIWNADLKQDFDAYVDGHSEKDLIDEYSTVIHELLHGYNETENKGHTYFIEKGIKVHVPFTEVFNSKELNSYVRKSLQDSIFRYGLYVGGKDVLVGLGKVHGVNNNASNEAMSVQLGIYGLVEEFSAYYYGDLAAFEQYDYFQKTYGKDNADAWDSYKQEVYGDVVAYYEFQLFIAWYLKFAKEKHPKMYEEIQKNKELRVVFTMMDDKFKNLISQIDEKCLKIKVDETAEATKTGFESLDFSGSDEDFIRFMLLTGLPKEEIYEEKTKLVNGKSVQTKHIILEKEELTDIKEEYTRFGKQYKAAFSDFKNTVEDGSQDEKILWFFGNREKQIIFLKQQMLPKMAAELKKLRIEGVTPQNYKDYLK